MTAMWNTMKDAEELGDYVCRQCGKCSSICPVGIDFQELFRLEGLFDRQMRTGKLDNASDFALRDRLRFWFGTDKRAVSEYKKLYVKGNECINCGACSNVCPYNIDIEI